MIPLFSIKGDAGMEVQVNFCISKDRREVEITCEKSSTARPQRGDGKTGVTKTEGAVAKETEIGDNI